MLARNGIVGATRDVKCPIGSYSVNGMKRIDMSCVLQAGSVLKIMKRSAHKGVESWL